MPWTPSEFKQRHARHLSDDEAAEASRVANGMLKAGVAEGEAIATAIARAKGQKPKHHAKPFGSLSP